MMTTQVCTDAELLTREGWEERGGRKMVRGWGEEEVEWGRRGGEGGGEEM